MTSRLNTLLEAIITEMGYGKAMRKLNRRVVYARKSGSKTQSQDVAKYARRVARIAGKRGNVSGKLKAIDIGHEHGLLGRGIRDASER